MKVLRSKCRTRVIFAKSDRDVITERIDNIDSVRLVDGVIQFLNGQGEVIVAANWEAIDLPETFTSVEKVIHLTEWLACQDVCKDKCEDCCEVEYEYFAKKVGSSVAAPATEGGGRGNHFILPDYNFEFPIDLDCKSAYEVHCHMSFIDGSNVASDANILANFFLDDSEITEARSGVSLYEPSQIHSLNSSFIIEGDVSGSTLTVGVINNEVAGRKLDDFKWNIIIKKIA